MIHHRIDNSHFISLITWLPKVIVFEIVAYTYNKCVECNAYLLKEFECKCGRIRCQYHAKLNMLIDSCFDCQNSISMKYGSNEISINCIVNNCLQYTWYGYKDILCYCRGHAKNKHNLIEYDYCFITGCWFVTNKKMIENNHPYCRKHMLRNCKYDYNYVTL